MPDPQKVLDREKNKHHLQGADLAGAKIEIKWENYLNRFDIVGVPDWQ